MSDRSFSLPEARLVRSPALLLVLLGLVGLPSASFAGRSGEWTIEARPSQERVQLSWHYQDASTRSWNSDEVRVSDLGGLDPRWAQASRVDVHFELTRDAGAFHFEGVAGHGR